MSLIKEFKTFVMKGNVLDMAIGIIIGGAFGKIVTSFVNDVLMPPIGLLLGGTDFKNLSWVLKTAEDGKVLSSLNYGLFINAVIDFLIIASTIFMVIKAINKIQKKEAEKPAEPPKPSETEVLLGEIRDLLKSK